MKTIDTLYGGCSCDKKDICSGDMHTVELLDIAVTRLIGNDYLKMLKKKNNNIKIKMSKLQYKGLKIHDL